MFLSVSRCLYNEYKRSVPVGDRNLKIRVVDLLSLWYEERKFQVTSQLRCLVSVLKGARGGQSWCAFIVVQTLSISLV